MIDLNKKKKITKKQPSSSQQDDKRSSTKDHCRGILPWIRSNLLYGGKKRGGRKQQKEKKGGSEGKNITSGRGGQRNITETAKHGELL